MKNIKILSLIIILQTLSAKAQNTIEDCALLKGVKKKTIDNVLRIESNLQLKPGNHTLTFSPEGYFKNLYKYNYEGIMNFTVECGKTYAIKYYQSNYVDSIFHHYYFNVSFPQIIEETTGKVVSQIIRPREFEIKDPAGENHYYPANEKINSNELVHLSIINKYKGEITIYGVTDDHYTLDFTCRLHQGGFYLKPGIYRIEFYLGSTKITHNVLADAGYNGVLTPNEAHTIGYQSGQIISSYFIPPMKSRGIIELNSIFYEKKSNQVWIAGDDGMVINSHDGGKNWTLSNIDNQNTENNTEDEGLSDIFFIDSIIGWTVGYKGTIAKKTRGTEKWSIIKENIAISAQDPIKSIIFFNNSEGMIYKDLGWTRESALYSNNGGYSWKVLDVGGSSYMFWDKSIIKNIKGEASSQISTDMGVTWKTFQKDHIIAMSYIDTLNGWFVLDNDPNIYRTRDQGANWTANKIDAIPKKICFVDSLTGWALCYRNIQGISEGFWARSDMVLYCTKDGGNTWTLCNDPEFAFYKITDMVFVDKNTGFAIGSSGFIFSTYDGGNTWSHINIIELL